jgi:hypothetical protein
MRTPEGCEESSAPSGCDCSLRQRSGGTRGKTCAYHRLISQHASGVLRRVMARKIHSNPTLRGKDFALRFWEQESGNGHRGVSERSEDADGLA